MDSQPQTSSKAIPLLLIGICIALAAATVYATRNSYILRFELNQAQNEIDSLKKQLNGKPATPVAEASEAGDTAKDEEIAKLREQLKQTKQTAEAAALMPRVAPGSISTNANRGSWMDRLRDQDPERYKRMQEAREQRRQQAETFFKDQQARLDERLQSAQTQEEADLVTQLSDTLSKMNDLRGQWDKINQLPEDQRREQAQQLGQESWQTYQAYSQLREQDRQMQLQQLASQIGYSKPQEAQQFTAAINGIIQDTDTSMNRMMGFGRGRGNPSGTRGNPSSQ